MPITKQFRKTILQRAGTDAEFRRHMLTEAVNELIGGDLNAGKSILRDYINATITFEGLAGKLKKSSKSVHRMLGPSGNPRAENILEIIKILQVHERITLQVKVKARRAA
jgi:DNA-binding phage protein